MPDGAAIKPRVFDASVDVVVRVEVRNPDVIERVTGDGGDEWRSRFYGLSTAEDVVEHLAFNFVRNGVVDVSRLDGWADCEVLVATLHACVTDRGFTKCEEPMQAVGVPQGWNHDSFQIGSVTGAWQTNIPWLEAVRIWQRAEAPAKEDVDALLTEQMELREAERDEAFKAWSVIKFCLKHDDDGNPLDIRDLDPDDPMLVASERFKKAVWSVHGLTIEQLEKHGRRNQVRILRGVDA